MRRVLKHDEIRSVAADLGAEEPYEAAVRSMAGDTGSGGGGPADAAQEGED